MGSREESAVLATPTLSASILEAWSSLAPEVRAALIASEGGSTASTSRQSSSVSSITSGSSDDSGEKGEPEGLFIEECDDTGSRVTLRPLERAPKNVFEISKTTSKETLEVEKTPTSTITTKKTVVTTTRGWRNVFTLPISYDVNMVPSGTLLDPANPQLLDATGVHSEGYNRRFAVIDEEVDKIYGTKIREYFTTKNIELTACVLKGGEQDKRPEVSMIVV